MVSSSTRENAILQKYTLTEIKGKIPDIRITTERREQDIQRRTRLSDPNALLVQAQEICREDLKAGLILGGHQEGAFTAQEGPWEVRGITHGGKTGQHGERPKANQDACGIVKSPKGVWIIAADGLRERSHSLKHQALPSGFISHLMLRIAQCLGPELTEPEELIEATRTIFLDPSLVDLLLEEERRASSTFLAVHLDLYGEVSYGSLGDGRIYQVNLHQKEVQRLNKLKRTRDKNDHLVVTGFFSANNPEASLGPDFGNFSLTNAQEAVLIGNDGLEGWPAVVSEEQKNNEGLTFEEFFGLLLNRRLNPLKTDWMTYPDYDLLTSGEDDCTAILATLDPSKLARRSLIDRLLGGFFSF